MLDKTFMTNAQFACQASNCGFCENKPCMKGCPVNCSPADFIMAAKQGEKSDFARAAAEILTANPLGGVCGLICPNTYCQANCSHNTFNGVAIEIPKMQAYVIEKAKKLGVMPKLKKAASRGKSVGIIGGGPAGLGARKPWRRAQPDSRRSSSQGSAQERYRLDDRSDRRESPDKDSY